MERALDDNGLRAPAAAADGLAEYLALLVRWRQRRRIAGPPDPRELAVEALADALRIDPLVPRGGTLTDVGSGAGFPGVPLALLDGSRQTTLVEAATARAALLRIAAATLHLPLRVLCRRGEQLADDVAAGEEAPADAAIARAFLPPDEWVALARRLVRPGGAIVVLAGRAWPGPAAGSGARVAERLDYELSGRGPRSAWRLVNG